MAKSKETSNKGQAQKDSKNPNSEKSKAPNEHASDTAKEKVAENQDAKEIKARENNQASLEQDLAKAKDTIKSLRPVKAQLAQAQGKISGLETRISELERTNDSLNAKLKSAKAGHESCLDSLGKTADSLEAKTRLSTQQGKRIASMHLGIDKLVAKGWFGRLFLSGEGIKNIIYGD